MPATPEERRSMLALRSASGSRLPLPTPGATALERRLHLADHMYSGAAIGVLVLFPPGVGILPLRSVGDTGRTVSTGDTGRTVSTEG